MRMFLTPDYFISLSSTPRLPSPTLLWYTGERTRAGATLTLSDSESAIDSRRCQAPVFAPSLLFNWNCKVSGSNSMFSVRDDPEHST